MSPNESLHLNRRQLLTLSTLAAASSACAGGSGGAGGTAGGETRTLTSATYIPPSYKDLYQAFTLFMDAAKKQSDGALEFDWHHSGTLLSAEQLVPGLRNGVADLVFQTSSYIASTYPVLGVTQLPFVTESYAEFREALDPRGELNKLLNSAMEPRGLHMLGSLPTSFEWFWTVDRPIRSPEDVKGLKIRVAGDTEAATVSALGGAPVTMSSAEVYQAIERGTVDGLVSYVGTIIGRSLQEVIRYGTAGHFGAYSVDAYVRSDWLNQQPGNVQSTLKQAGMAYFERGTDAMVQIHESDYLPTIENAGVEFVELTDAQRRGFKEATQPVYESWRREMNDAQLADRALELMRS